MKNLVGGFYRLLHGGYPTFSTPPQPALLL